MMYFKALLAGLVVAAVGTFAGVATLAPPAPQSGIALATPAGSEAADHALALAQRLARFELQLDALTRVQQDTARLLARQATPVSSSDAGRTPAELDARIAQLVRGQLSVLENDLLARMEDGAADSDNSEINELAAAARDDADWLLDAGHQAGALDDEQMEDLALHMGEMDPAGNKAFWEQFNEAVAAGDVMLPQDSLE